MIYLRARYYDPSTAQFISRDPITLTTRQPYSYTNDNPLNLTDPTGLFGWNDITNAVGSFVQDNASTIQTVAQGASVGAGILSIAALGCAATVVCAPAAAVLEGGALALGATALIADASLAAFDGGSWSDAALDALTLAPGVGVIGAEARAARYGTMFGRTLRAGCDASSYRAAMMDWRGAASVGRDIEGMGALVDMTHGGVGLQRRYLGWE